MVLFLRILKIFSIDPRLAAEIINMQKHVVLMLDHSALTNLLTVFVPNLLGTCFSSLINYAYAITSPNCLPSVSRE